MSQNGYGDFTEDAGFPGDRGFVGSKVKAKPLGLPFRLYRDFPLEMHKEWQVAGLLGADEFSIFFGEPGSGKSVLVEDLMLHTAGGLSWHGHAVRAGLAIYIALERHSLVERRALAFRKKTGIDDLPFAIVPGPINFVDKHTAPLILDTISRIENAYGQPAVIIGIDTVSAALCGGDENSPKDMGGFVNTVRHIQEGIETQGRHAHLLGVHHQPHDAQRLRGHGLLLGAVDVTVEVNGKSESMRTATVRKTNDGEEGLRISFTLESVDIGPDTTAPVVVSVETPAYAKKEKGTKLPAAAKVALTALTEAVLEVGEVPPASNHVPNSTKVVTIEQWRKYAYARSISETPDARQKAFKRASEALAAVGMIGIWEPYVWPA